MERNIACVLHSQGRYAEMTREHRVAVAMTLVCAEAHAHAAVAAEMMGEGSGADGGRTVACRFTVDGVQCRVDFPSEAACDIGHLLVLGLTRIWERAGVLDARPRPRPHAGNVIGAQ